MVCNLSALGDDLEVEQDLSPLLDYFVDVLGCILSNTNDPVSVLSPLVPGERYNKEKCFKSHFTTLFQASWLSFEAFISLMRIGCLYYNCLGFVLASDYTDVVLNTVLDIVSVRI